MNDKFFDLKKEKQDSMIGSALKVFALNGFSHASTDEIVAEASVSKGLLFHYFYSKAGLYSFLIEYCARFALVELNSELRRQEALPFFELTRAITRAEASSMRRYPYLMLFLERVRADGTSSDQDKDSLAYAREHNIGVINYSPLAQGILTGKFPKDRKIDVNDGRSHASLFQQPYFNQAIDVAEALRPYAEKYNVTLAQLAIRMCMQNPAITAPIVGAKSEAQVLDNVKACDFEISVEDYEAIDKLSLAFTDTLPTFKSFFWQ